MTALELTLLYLLAAVLGVVACRSLKLPPMLGYLAVGVVIGPNALALTENSVAVRHLGEFGVVLGRKISHRRSSAQIQLEALASVLALFRQSQTPTVYSAPRYHLRS